MRFRRRSDQELAATKFAGRESATAKRDRKEAARSAARRKGHRDSIPTATRAERAWQRKDRREFGDEHPFPRH